MPIFSLFLLLLLLWGLPAPAPAQTIESAGSRAQGMGGAFVAVADDSSATWWNPGALAAGPFVDVALTRSITEVTDRPGRRERVASFALGTPVIGISYYRFRITDVDEAASTGAAGGDRQDTRTGVMVRSLPASQFGVTVVQSLLPGVHAGTTLKYVRGRVGTSAGHPSASASDLLQEGDDLKGGDVSGQFDLDAGVIAVGGPVRVGLVGRNLRRARFEDVVSGTSLALPRQVRFGAAFSGEGAGVIPLTVSIDADLRRYDAAGGDRRVVAVGAEQWFLAHRLGVRGGARFNTVASRERAATGGISVAVRSALYVDAHVVGGGGADERGWGAAVRMSF